MKTASSLLWMANRGISIFGKRPFPIACSKLLHGHHTPLGTFSPVLSGSFNLSRPSRSFHLQSTVYQMSQDSSYTGQMGRNWDELSLEELKALMESKDLTLIDVREPEEVEKYGKIPGAVCIPLGKVTNALRMQENSFQEMFKCPKPMTHGQDLVFYGYASSGMAVKSDAAVKMANRLGYKRARHFVGGYREWVEKGNKVSGGTS